MTILRRAALVGVAIVLVFEMSIYLAVCDLMDTMED